MQTVHNQKMSQLIAGSVTIILEALFAFLGGWTLYDVFNAWGTAPGIIIGSLAGLVFFLLELYVFIYREYATEASKLFARRVGEAVNTRANWGVFLVVVCILMDTFFNLDRMISLPLANDLAKAFIFLGLEMLILVPFALGKLVHAHINVSDPSAKQQMKIVQAVDNQIYTRMQEILPTLSASELLQLKAGNLDVLQRRIDAVESERTIREEEQKAATRPQEIPLLGSLQGLIRAQPQIAPQADIVRKQKEYDIWAQQQGMADDLANSVGGGSARPLSQASQNGHSQRK